MLAVVVLVAAHAALFGFAFGGHTSLALLTAVASVLALKYVWWRFRR